jgi:hypothetical protein
LGASNLLAFEPLAFGKGFGLLNVSVMS